MSPTSLHWIQSKGQLFLPSACLAASLLHNTLLIGVKKCLCSPLTALSNLNLKAIRLRSERSVYEREREKNGLPFWAILSRFTARSLFKQNVSSAIWVTLRSLTFSETSSLLCSHPLFSFPPRLIIKHAQLSQI